MKSISTQKQKNAKNSRFVLLCSLKINQTSAIISIMKKFIDSKCFIFPETREKLDCSLLNCGHENAVSASYNFHGMKRGRRELAIWQYTLGGYGIFDFNGTKQKVLPGQAFIAIIPENNCYYLPKTSENWEFIYLTLTGQNSIKLFKEYRRRYGSVITYPPESSVINMAWDILQKGNKNEIESAYELSAIAYNFIMQMFCESRFDAEINLTAPVWLQRVKEFCARNISSDIMIEDMAKIANCSKWHFSRQFSLYEGISPYRYLINLRIKMATQLLENSNFSIKEIAEKCGFYDLAYFSKIFKAHMNILPKNYRK